MGIVAQITAAGALVTLLGGGAWQGYDAWEGLRESVASNTFELRKQTYDRLLRKYKAEGGLSTSDAIDFCAAARYLHIGGAVVKKVCG